jgi:type II secretory pathway component PulM
MNVQFLLFVIAILLVLIFWELSKIHSRLKKKLPEERAKLSAVKPLTGR